MTGFETHLARLRRLVGDALAQAADAAVDEGAAALAQAARDAAGSGSLSAGIKVERVGPGRAEVRSTAPHAAVMEYGTSSSPGRPHLRPAAQRMRPMIVARFAHALRGLVRGG